MRIVDLDAFLPAPDLGGTLAPDDLPPPVEGPVMVRVAGEPVAIQAPLPDLVAGPLRSAVRRLTYSRLARPGGMASTSRTFGFAPRMPARGFDACRSAILADESPAEHAVLAAAASHLRAELASHYPTAVAQLDTAAHSILPDWRFPAAPWTSGIINQSSVLRYHRDSNNLRTWSIMPVFRRWMAGGHLHLPELGLVLALPDAYYASFPGWQLLHGVTALAPSRPQAYRYSIVYYQLRGMGECLPPEDELRAALARRTGREARWAGVEAGDPEAIADAARAAGMTVEEFEEARHGH